jgi:translation initiation factor IF-3
VPVPRRFDRRPPERDQTRINDRIRVPEVRLVGEDGKQIGVIKTSDALVYAQERDLDLVEVAPDARPPVCRVLDYSKFKYELAQKQKAARKHQQQITIREIKFRPKIALNDYETKKGHVTRFLLGKDKVKITIMFRGREVTHPERGVALLNKLAEELSEIAAVEQMPLQDGRNMTMMLGPSKAVLAAESHDGHEEGDGEEHAVKPHKHHHHQQDGAQAGAAEAAGAEQSGTNDEPGEDTKPAEDVEAPVSEAPAAAKPAPAKPATGKATAAKSAAAKPAAAAPADAASSDTEAEPAAAEAEPSVTDKPVANGDAPKQNGSSPKPNGSAAKTPRSKSQAVGARPASRGSASEAED